ncbi:TIGR03557 family F420-dependent LLM class oxidoreductase [Actinosynnema sp. NPDC023658]|uniref:TIGR03557 family F420-dependent LLM class oxidoreductase n=1 Tax=Actinosynnema sp. NPDC023658 TaxID=3155465 RepID=UPI0033F9D1B3
MVSIGYFLSSEEHGPRELVRQARWAEEAGFERLWISDHYHPWNHEQGNSPFVWSVIGALSEATSLPITTAVTCPTVRIHPAVVAQAAATAAVQCRGGFTLGVGSGEALNEHIFGDRWPSAPERLEMLEEAVEVMRALWSGDEVSHRGRHYTVEHAKLYTLPAEPVPVYVSAFGPKAAELAGRIGDGLCSTIPDPSLLEKFRDAGGAGKPTQAGLKVCHASSAEAAVKTAHRLWANEQLPGELAQVLPTPQHFEQASTLVTEEMVGSSLPVGPDPEPYVDAVREYAEAGYDEVYVGQIGPDQEQFFSFWAESVAPALRGATSSPGGAR